MGTIDGAIILDEVVELFGIKNFVETGTYQGKSMSIMLKYDIDLYGIELNEEFYSLCKDKFGELVHLFLGYSEEQMGNVMNQMSPDPCLFWLDAHYPEFWKNPKDPLAWREFEPDKDKRMPLEKEMQIISSMRDCTNDVFAIDDLRLYKKGNFQYGDFPVREYENHDFIKTMFGESHYMIEHTLHEGYLILFPKTKSLDQIRECTKTDRASYLRN